MVPARHDLHSAQHGDTAQALPEVSSQLHGQHLAPPLHPHQPCPIYPPWSALGENRWNADQAAERDLCVPLLVQSLGQKHREAEESSGVARSSIL